MKYIKTYEVNKKNRVNFGDFLVIISSDLNHRTQDNRYYIVQVLKVNENVMNVIKLYTYKNGQFIKYSDEVDNPKPFNLRFNNSLLEIVYDSNSLGDIFNMVEIMDKSSKYNI